MNEISKETIRQILNKDLEYLETVYNKKRILCIFVTGIANYGFAETADEINTEALYLPSFEDLCLNTGAFQKTFKIGNRTIVVKDFRLVKQSAYHRNNEVEALFTDYIIVNPAYEDLYQQYFKSLNELIATCNYKIKVKEAAEEGLQALRDDDWFTAYRYYHYCNYLYSKRVYAKSIFITDPIYSGFLYRLKHDKFADDEVDRQQLFEFFKRTIAKIEQDNPPKEEPKELKIGIIEIMRLGMNENSDISDFLQKLTDTEKTVLEAIKQTIGVEGEIIISKMTTQTGISRPVFNNLIMKMKDSHVAEITNMGAKGTHIKFLNPILKK